MRSQKTLSSLLFDKLRIPEVDIKVNTPDHHIPVVQEICIVRQIISIHTVAALDVTEVDVIGIHIIEA